MKNKHRIKQGLSLLLAGALTFTNVGAALPAFAEDAPATPETASAATPETAEANVPTPNLSQITENLYNDLPDAPTGSYLGSMGLPVATGETKIGISAWVSDLYDGVDAHMDADALNADENTVTIGKTPGTDYAIVPLLAQVEYPADGAVSEIILPDGVELLSYRSTDYEPIPADEQEQAEILHQTYSEQSAAATGLYVKASADFTAQLVYTDSDGSSQSKAIHVQISEDAAPTQMYADTGDDSIAAYAAGPTPPYTTGKITSIAKEGGTWLIWFNGQEAYCCSHGLNGQPKGCPTYSFSHVSRLEPGQYTPGNHYANQVNIWGGLGQLSLDMLDDRPVVASLEDDPEGCEEQPDILGSLYDETQQWIMENYKGTPPTLQDFYRLLQMQPEPEAQGLALSSELFITGTLNTFARHTNVDTQARIIAYDIRELGEQLMPLGMLVTLDAIYNHVIQNWKKGRRTWIFCDEFYILFRYEYSANFFYKLWKRIRKYNGLVTGLTQNVDELLRSDTARLMLANSEFLVMLNQSTTDREELAKLLNISDNQLGYVTNVPAGCGLIRCAGNIVPFTNSFPKNTKLYGLMTTKPDEVRKE